ncbi:hypothetical protein DM860_017841 [Cuscuta australis]|uniref:Uncharacterized protein n=1 Tax=Cuscuta australis TaxID=267555 RepID=A0A328DS09_9ASTE|nr:hypothetical protein DM860_017841 [Cuscuta australis]
MGTRVPVPHYDLRPAAASYIDSSVHDINAAEGLGGESHDVDPGGGDAKEDSLHNDEEDSATVDCLHDSFQNSLPLHIVTVEDNQSSVSNSGSSSGSYNIVTIDDVSPIESARARFLDIIVDHFISSHVIEVFNTEPDCVLQSSQDKVSKRKLGEIQREGDPRHVLPLMYVANMYETLVAEVNLRLSSLSGMREKNIGVALEAAGGLYRKLAKKFPRNGSCTYKRRELATSFETRSRFPELVIQEEKRVRFVVVNGLAIVERPTSMLIDDIEWFKRLTGRSEVSVSPRDYKFYAPRHKYRRVASNPIPNMRTFPTFTGTDSGSPPMSAAQGYHSVSEQPQNSHQIPPPEQQQQHMQATSHQAQFHPLQQSHLQHQMNQNQHIAHLSHCRPHSHLSEIVHSQHSATIPTTHMSPLQPIGHAGGRMLLQPAGPAKFCDECGAPYLRDTSKYCSECGVKRLGI